MEGFRVMHYRKFLHEIRESCASRCTIENSFRGESDESGGFASIACLS